MAGPRVVLTGVGSVSPLAAGGTAAVAGALADPSGGPGPGAAVHEAMLAGLLDRDAARRMSRICQLAVAACRLAVADAGVPGGPGLGLVVGSEHGDFRSSEGFAAGYLRRGPGGLSPMLFPSTVMNTMAAAAAIDVSAKGPTITLNQGTVAGDLAVVQAVALLAAERAEAVVAGGVDELYPAVQRQLERLGARAPRLGEGASFVVLETAGAARARGARVLAEVLGAETAALPARPHGRPRPGSGRSPVRDVLARAGLGPEALGACYGAANGDAAVDEAELALLRAELGEGPAVLPPRSLAGRFGQHGGLGALRAAAAALEVQRHGRPVLVHGLARGGCRTALLLGAAPC
jgi:3-oxoacyl-[acyl-carrier-protein] synthase II